LHAVERQVLVELLGVFWHASGAIVAAGEAAVGAALVAVICEKKVGVDEKIRICMAFFRSFTA